MTKRMQNDLSLNEYLNFIDRAIEYTYNSGIYIIYPTETIESLETLWSQFMSQPKSVRKKSDVESYRIFGMDNFDHYMALRDEYEVQSRTNPYLREYIEESSMDIKAKEEKIYNHVHMVMEKRKKEPINESVMSELDLTIKEAIAEAKEKGVVIVYPCDTIEAMTNLFDQYNAMTDADKKIANDICKKYFNIDNNEKFFYKYKAGNFTEDEKKNLYTKISPDEVKTNPLSFVKRYMKKTIDNEDPKTVMETALKLYNLLETDLDRKLFEDSITKDIADREVMDNDIVDMDILYNDLPYFTADRMIDLGVFSGTTNCFDNIADNTVLEDGTKVADWFEAYKNNQINYLKEHNLARIHTLERLYSDLQELEESGDINKLNARKQSILELGWDPEVAFSPENRAINDKKVKDFLDKKSKFIDLRGITDEDIPGYLENSKGEKLYPIFIILVSRKKVISNLIKYFTKSDVSHAAIAFDANLKDCWSFDGTINLKAEQPLGGFGPEPVEIYEDHYIEVYCTFIKKKYYENLKYTIEYFKKNKGDFEFDHISFLKYLFGIDVNQTNRFVCSSFTDRMLQVANVNLRNNNEYKKLVSPQKLKTDLSLNNKIYMLYSGKANEYDGKKVDDLVNAISKKAEYFSENALLKENLLTIEDIDTDFFPIDEAVDLQFTFKKKKKFPLFFLYYYDNIYLSITPDLKELYYFNKNVNGSQLLKTSASDFPQTSIVGLYICFVKEDRYRKVLDFIEEATAPFYKYTYSQLNILYKLMNINFGTNTPDKMCIEMIDKIIRLSDCVDAKKMDDIQKPVYKNFDELIKRKLDIYGKIYKIYFDRLENYNMTSTELFIAANIEKAKLITESFSTGSFYKSVILDPDPVEVKPIKHPTAFKQLMEYAKY